MIEMTGRRVHSSVSLLVVAVAVVGSNSLLMGPIAPGIAQDLDAPVPRVLLSSAGYGLGTGVGALLLSRWIDKLGFVQVLRIAFLTLCLAFSLSALSFSVTLLVAAQTIAGLAAGVALPAVYAFSAYIAPAGSESRVLGRVLTGWTVSLVLGVSLAALLADHLHWRAVYLVLLAPALYVLVTMLRLPRDQGVSDVAGSPLVAIRVKGVPALLWQVSMYMIAFYGAYALTGDHVVSALERPLSANALLAASYGLGFGAAAWCHALIDRAGAVRSTPVFLFALALVYLALALVAHNYWWLVVVAFAWGLFNHLAVNGLIAQLSAIDAERRGTILGLYSGFTYLCMSFATFVFAALYAGGAGFYPGWPGLVVISAVCCLLASLQSGFKKSPQLRF